MWITWSISDPTIDLTIFFLDFCFLRPPILLLGSPLWPERPYKGFYNVQSEITLFRNLLCSNWINGFLGSMYVHDFRFEITLFCKLRSEIMTYAICVHDFVTHNLKPCQIRQIGSTAMLNSEPAMLKLDQLIFRFNVEPVILRFCFRLFCILRYKMM
jgi:hypothetical protein